MLLGHFLIEMVHLQWSVAAWYREHTEFTSILFPQIPTNKVQQSLQVQKDTWPQSECWTALLLYCRLKSYILLRLITSYPSLLKYIFYSEVKSNFRHRLPCTGAQVGKRLCDLYLPHLQSPPLLEDLEAENSTGVPLTILPRQEQFTLQHLTLNMGTHSRVPSCLEHVSTFYSTPGCLEQNPFEWFKEENVWHCVVVWIRLDQGVALSGGVALSEEVCHCGGRLWELLLTTWKSVFCLPSEQAVEFAAPPAPCLPGSCHAPALMMRDWNSEHVSQPQLNVVLYKSRLGHGLFPGMETLTKTHCDWQSPTSAPHPPTPRDILSY
jgi:hypothetical protein